MAWQYDVDKKTTQHNPIQPNPNENNPKRNKTKQNRTSEQCCFHTVIMGFHNYRKRVRHNHEGEGKTNQNKTVGTLFPHDKDESEDKR